MTVTLRILIMRGSSYEKEEILVSNNKDRNIGWSSNILTFSGNTFFSNYRNHVVGSYLTGLASNIMFLERNQSEHDCSIPWQDSIILRQTGLLWERESGRGGHHGGGEGGLQQGRSQLAPHPHQSWSGSQHTHNNIIILENIHLRNSIKWWLRSFGEWVR